MITNSKATKLIALLLAWSLVLSGCDFIGSDNERQRVSRKIANIKLGVLKQDLSPADILNQGFDLSSSATVKALVDSIKGVNDVIVLANILSAYGTAGMALIDDNYDAQTPEVKWGLLTALKIYDYQEGYALMARALDDNSSINLKLPIDSKAREPLAAGGIPLRLSDHAYNLLTFQLQDWALLSSQIDPLYSIHPYMEVSERDNLIRLLKMFWRNNQQQLNKASYQ